MILKRLQTLILGIGRDRSLTAPLAKPTPIRWEVVAVNDFNMNLFRFVAVQCRRALSNLIRALFTFGAMASVSQLTVHFINALPRSIGISVIL